jgi:AcrR family transcriptional regulator
MQMRESGHRREHKVAMVREGILDAATRVFARRGFQAATMAQIAREAEYTAPSLYNYFDGKDAIIEALGERIYREFLATFDEPVPAGMTFEQRVELLVRRQMDVAERRRDAFQAFIAAGEKRIGERERVRFETFMKRLTKWLRQAATNGELGGRKPEEIAWYLWGVGHAFQVKTLLDPPSRNHTSPELIVGLFLHGVTGPARLKGKRS